MPVRILVVDEDPNLPAQVQRACGSMSSPAAVTGVATASDALDALLADRYDVIVTDVCLADADGTDLLEDVRRRHPQLVRILVAGRADRALVYASFGVAHRTVPKPWRPVPLQRVMGFTCEAVADVPEMTRSALTSLRTLPGHTAPWRAGTTPRWPVHEPSGVAAVERDPAWVAQVLRLSSSHYFGARRTEPDLLASVALLGPSVVDILSEGMDRPDRDELWAIARRTAAHAIRTAELARDLAIDAGCAPGVAEQAFTAGLLHEVGQLVRAGETGGHVASLSVAPSAGTHGAQPADTAARLGARLLSLWGIPAAITAPVADHKCPSRAAGPPSLGALAVLHVADAIQHALDAGTVPDVDRDYLRSLGLEHRVAEWFETAADTSQTA